MSFGAAGPERAEVAARQVLDAVVLARLERADPLGREPVRVCAALLPRAARRHADQVDPVPDSNGEGAELLARDRPPAQVPSQLSSSRRDLPVVGALVDAQAPLLARAPDPRGEERVVAPRDEMDRLAHQRPLDHASPPERPRQVVALEPLDGRPEPDVPVRRVLVLDPADPLEHPRDRQAHALEQQLPGEERPVQLPRRQDALGHGRRPCRTTLRGCTMQAAHGAAMRLGVEAALVDGKLVSGDVEVHEGRIARYGIRRGSGRSGIAAPGFVDLQVNGFGGVDFATADAAGYERAGEALLETGVTAYLPTLITAPEPALAASLREVPRESGGPRILGVHVEGPFLAAARMGTHLLEGRLDPDPDVLERLLDAGPVRLVTLAPELPGALELIDLLLARGVAVSCGHTDATAEEAEAAFDRGALPSPTSSMRCGPSGIATRASPARPSSATTWSSS